MPRLPHAVLAGFLLAPFAMAAPASAAPGFATGDVNLRAGPGTQYPRVVVVPGAAEVEIFGCLPGYGWCDVGFAGVRGWVSSSYLQVAYEGQRYVGPTYVPRVGVPIVTYRADDYWDRYYRDRPWYGERQRWVSVPPPAYRPPPPVAYVPPRYAAPLPPAREAWREERGREGFAYDRFDRREDPRLDRWERREERRAERAARLEERRDR
jgi:uncharacterized protein YraI